MVEINQKCVACGAKGVRHEASNPEPCIVCNGRGVVGSVYVRLCSHGRAGHHVRAGAVPTTESDWRSFAESDWCREAERVAFEQVGWFNPESRRFCYSDEKEFWPDRRVGYSLPVGFLGG